jgi:prepilin-type N-terminal cleavage/methylation domain-containing protein
MPAPSAHVRPSANGPRRGFTLVELIVVLLLVGLALALAAPSFARPRVPEGDAFRRVLDAARATAVRRAETLTLDVRADGAWSITGADTALALGGVLDSAPARPLRLSISPLGACLPDLTSGPATDARAWDPLRCADHDAAGRAP